VEAEEPGCLASVGGLTCRMVSRLGVIDDMDGPWGGMSEVRVKIHTGDLKRKPLLQIVFLGKSLVRYLSFFVILINEVKDNRA
jgi:hypothetical protein